MPIESGPSSHADNVIQTIKEEAFLDGDGLTKEENEIIGDMMKGLDEAGLTKVKEYIESLLHIDVKQKLDALLKQIESNNQLPKLEYGMDSLKANINSDMYKNLLELKFGGQNMYDLWLSNLINKKKLGTGIQDNISPIIFNKLVSEIGANPGIEHFSKLAQFIPLMGGDKVDIKGEEFSILDMGKLLSEIKEYDIKLDSGKGEIELNGEKIKVSEIIEQFIGKLDTLVDGYFDNLSALENLAKKQNKIDSPEYKNLLDNPIILNELLDKGVYKKYGFNIDLKTGDFEIDKGENTDEIILEAQSEFMQKAIDTTNKNGGEIEALSKDLHNVAGELDKAGIGPSKLNKFKEFLYQIPILGDIIKIIFGQVFDGLQTELEGINLEKNIKKCTDNLSKLITDKDDKLPFESDGKIIDGEDRKDNANLLKFVNHVNKQEIKENGGNKVEKTIIGKDDFWTNIFSENTIKGEKDSLYNRTRREIMVIKGDGSISQKEFFEKLAKVQIKDKPKEEKKEKPKSDSPEEKKQ